jgi:hypothetical protein
VLVARFNLINVTLDGVDALKMLRKHQDIEEPFWRVNEIFVGLRRSWETSLRAFTIEMVINRGELSCGLCSCVKVSIH